MTLTCTRSVISSMVENRIKSMSSMISDQNLLSPAVFQHFTVFVSNTVLYRAAVGEMMIQRLAGRPWQYLVISCTGTLAFIGLESKPSGDRTLCWYSSGKSELFLKVSHHESTGTLAFDCIIHQYVDLSLNP